MVDVELAISLLDSDTVPSARFIDVERGIDMPVMMTDVVIDAEGHSAELKVRG